MFELVVEDRLKRTQLLTLLALTACSRLKRTQPLNQHFFFSPSSCSFCLLRPPSRIFSPEKSLFLAPRRHGDVATRPSPVASATRASHAYCVHMCCFYRDPILLQFAIQQNQPGRGGRRRNSEETKRLSQHGLHTHTTRTFVSIRPPIRNFLPSLIFP